MLIEKEGSFGNIEKYYTHSARVGLLDLPLFAVCTIRIDDCFDGV
jgi:hypothetical protein